MTPTDARERSRSVTATGPTVSIVVVGWKEAPDLVECLEHLAQSSQDVDYEIIVGLNEPTSPLTKKIEETFPSVGISSSTANLGFAAACNRAVASSRGRLVMLLNDDARPHDHALDVLREVLDGQEEVMAAGSKFLYPDGRLQEAGAVLWSDGSVIQISHFVDPVPELVDEPRRCDYCSAAALMVRRADWDAVGGMDEGYFPMYYEDVDLCLKLTADHGMVRYEPRSVVTHVMGSSSSLHYREYLVRRNQQRFAERWSELLARHDPRPDPMSPEAVRRAAEKASRRPTDQPRQLPPLVHLPQRAGAKTRNLEREVLRDYALDLDRVATGYRESLADRDSTIADLREELAKRELSLKELEAAVTVRDRYLEAAEEQIEDLARRRAEAADELEAVLNRRTVQAAERVARELRSIPGAESAARHLVGRIRR